MFIFFFITIVGSGFMFLIGLIQLMVEKDKKENALKLMMYSLIGLIIGFGSCFAMIYN
jgi:heme O synthase-like polyprenyltransferase